MVRSEARDVDDYLAQVPEPRRAALTRLRALCREVLTDFTELMRYGMPCYAREETAEVAFASQKQYISIYIMRTDVVDAHAGRLAGQDMGKGCLRYRNPGQLSLCHVDTITERSCRLVTVR
jgi:uncharacterized protein YdhG (YjbR/CyaY superfamily)